MEITANNPKELLADFGSEVMALVQRGETDKLAKLTDDAHEELLFLINEQTVERIVRAVNCHDGLVEALKYAEAFCEAVGQGLVATSSRDMVKDLIKQALAKAEAL